MEEYIFLTMKANAWYNDFIEDYFEWKYVDIPKVN